MWYCPQQLWRRGFSATKRHSSCCTANFSNDVPRTKHILGGAANQTAGQNHNYKCGSAASLSFTFTDPPKENNKVTKQRRPPATSSYFYRLGRLLGRRFRRGDRYPSPGKSKPTATLALARKKRRDACHHPFLARRACFVRLLPTMAATLLTLQLCSSGATCLSPARCRYAWQLYPISIERDAK